MSALVPFADSPRTSFEVREVPLAAMSSRSNLASLLDHLVSAGEHRRRHLNAERFGGRQIDDEIEFGWLLNRQVGRLRPAQNLVDEIGGAAIELQKVRSIGHQTACVEILPLRINCR